MNVTERYDVAVVGSGIGGVTAAALLAREGRRVVVVERADAPGGCVHSFRRGAYRLDPAVHLVVDPPHIRRLLGHLGVNERVEFVDVPHFYSAQGPGVEIAAPFGREEFIAAHVDRFGEAVRPFLDSCVKVHELLHELPGQMPLDRLEATVSEDPRLLGLLKATLGDAMDELLPPGPARTALGLPGLYLGVAPHGLAFRTYAQMLLSHVVHGAALVHGGPQRLVDAIVASIERDGGELIVGHAVTRIGTDGTRVTGVCLDDGREVGADVVVSNADPLQTFEQLVGMEKLPEKYVRRLRRLPRSDSVFSLFAGTSIDMDRFPLSSHLMFVTRDADLDRAFASGLAERPGYLCLCIPTLAEPDAAPHGEHLIMASTTASYDPGRPWDEVRDGYAEAILVQLEELFPGVRNTLTFTETATPLAIERHTGNRGGCAYAWGNSPSGVGSRPPTNDTPIDGLFLAGAWTAPGSGFARAINSGHSAAQQVLAAGGSDVELPQFMS